MSSSLAEKLDMLVAMGVAIRVDRGKAKFRYSSIDAERVRPLINDLRQQREAVVQILQQRGVFHTAAAERQPWPRRSLELVEKFSRPYMQLLPFIGERVSTPEGLGRLVQVLGAKEARVALDRNPTRMTSFDWEQILPLNMTQ